MKNSTTNFAALLVTFIITLTFTSVNAQDLRRVCYSKTTHIEAVVVKIDSLDGVKFKFYSDNTILVSVGKNLYLEVVERSFTVIPEEKAQVKVVYRLENNHNLVLYKSPTGELMSYVWTHPGYSL